MSKLVEKAYLALFPGQQEKYNFSLKYSGKFKDYNANIKKIHKNIEVCLSKKWRGVNKEIIIGLIQNLLLKILKQTKETINIDLYNSFIKKLHIAIPKERIDATLLRSFTRVNEKYFYNIIEVPNLIWGNYSKRKLGSYDFHTDTISISKYFQHTELELLDYVMYHELLHKKYKFENKKGKNYFHHSKFKKAEKEFENSEVIENKLKYIGRRNVRKKKVNFLSKWF